MCLCVGTIVIVAIGFIFFSKKLQLFSVVLFVGLLCSFFLSVIASFLVALWLRYRDRRVALFQRNAGIVYLSLNPLNELKVYKYSIQQITFQEGSSTQSINSTQTVCSICLSDFEIDDELIELPCSHSYHRECITEWLLLKSQCPTCKANVGIPQYPSVFNV